MHPENEAALTPEFLQTHLKAMSELQMSEQATEMFGLFVGLVSTMNMLQPEGYSEAVPALTFQAVKE
ncbi:MAG: hypothetical protein JSV16_04380 [Candidatus Hydrogenedentota bacterium]|nr:MAG: hypothetical protein JSV16_04380 [Candidatus Hydrogenedentota bacterium]